MTERKDRMKANLANIYAKEMMRPDTLGERQMSHKYKSNIPLARAKLHSIANRLRSVNMARAARLIDEVIEQHMHQKKSLPHSRPRSVHITPEIRAEVRRLHMTTELSQQQIAVKLHINAGRVSEILAGKS